MNYFIPGSIISGYIHIYTLKNMSKSFNTCVKDYFINMWYLKKKNNEKKKLNHQK